MPIVEIPPFTLSGVLPPFVGNPAIPAHMSPFQTTLVKLVERYSTTPRRIQLLSGFLTFRAGLFNAGVTSGFQWLDGSFLEDIEKSERRDPGDIDVVSFVRFPAWATADQGSWDRFAQSNAGLFDRGAKVTLGCDSYFVDLDLDAEDIVASTRYWFGLFSHKKRSSLWKGMLEIALSNPQDDIDARMLLQSKVKP
jgi:hypothetical protein